jgi:hypothetical protein
MAARLGLQPWERRRMTPQQLRELWEGERWRQSRLMDMIAVAAAWISNRIPLNQDATQPDDVARAMAGYVPWEED